MEPDRKKYTFFDFDGTLTRRDSLIGFIIHVHGVAGLLRALAAAAPAILLWKAGLRSGDSAKLRLFRAAFRGMSLADFRRAGESYARKIEGITRTDTVAALGHAVRQGEEVAIVSASCGDWIRPWAEGHGVRRVIATEVEVDADGFLTGAFSTPNCRGPEKVRRILDEFPQLGEDRTHAEVTVFGDSSGDDEMLGFADRGIRI